MLEQFENYITSNPIKSQSFHPFYEKALNEMILAGGKRFRPALMLSVVNSFNKELVEQSFPIALSIEMMHTYSLIHDDLPEMDDANLRRSHPTLHVTYDHATATLVGDALNTHAFQIISQSDLNDSIKIKLVEELSKAAGSSGMVLGQALDIYFENKALELEKIKFLHKNKTGKMIAASLKMGAIISNQNIEFQNKIYDFGIELGLLFQIQDDILDIISDSEKEGKPTNNDEDKNTFISLLGLEKSIEEAVILAKKLEEDLKKFDENLQENLGFLLQKYLWRHQR